MNDKRTLEQDYKNLKRLETPDLWSRIEKNLKSHPDRSADLESRDPLAALDPPPSSPRTAGPKDTPPAKVYPFSHILSCRALYKEAAFAAAAILLAVLVPWRLPDPPQRSKSPEEITVVTAETTAGGRDTAPKDTETQTFSQDKADLSLSVSAVSYSQLSLTPYTPLTVPANAQTVPEDAVNFSEDILGDMELLCQGTVTFARLETDANGKAVGVSYEIALDQVYYSQDYVTDTAVLTVTAPIIEATNDSGSQGHVLYQLQPGASYLLPLKNQNGNWQLLCAFAPQIQITPGGAYLFHSGYLALAGPQARVVIKDREGDNDYYYDRMLLREDDGFLGDFLEYCSRIRSKQKRF